MKKIILSLFLIYPLFLCSCGISPDQMLENYNNSVYEEDIKENGIKGSLETPDDSVDLIKNTYRIMEQSDITVETSKNFMSYEWKIRDSQNGNEQVIGNSYFVNINSAVQNWKDGENYSLILLVKSRNDIYFTDTATLKVVKNIYN